MNTRNEWLDSAILEASKRRTVSADVEARRNGIEVSEAQRSIRRLHRRGWIYRTEDPVKNFFGSGFAGYRYTYHK